MTRSSCHSWCPTWAAILVLEQGSETASVLAQEITVYAQHCTLGEHENVLKSFIFITLVLCSDSEKSEFVLQKFYNLGARNTRLKNLHRLLYSSTVRPLTSQGFHWCKQPDCIWKIEQAQGVITNGPNQDKTCLRGFRQSKTQTSSLSYRD